MFAIIRIGPTQYKVSVGDVIDVARMPGEVGDVITLSDMLLVADDKKVKVGKPTVKGTTIEAKIEAQYKGDKIDVRRFKSKVRERKHIGFRPQFTKLLITAIHA
ncbi:50S ribosomal protein L21 [Candidatus Gottesmanbacteria bacterium]|nr:50S ribosomal protein L21 [Candidatus Gottesmanbacteria bacterium]